jgi:alkanesulfonate monooxygenase SsuD/methylene tetrahydromethanopterin reductase-like flavin-dependent oxidoreductase (luciferase family)
MSSADSTLMLPRARRRPGFGIALPTQGALASPDNIFAVAGKAEALGYDDVWVNDHLSVSGTRGGGPVGKTRDPNYFESLSTLAAVGGRYARIGLAVHSLVLPIRDPRLVARQLSTMEELSGKRITVAPGIGSSQEDYAALGIPFEMRGRLMDEHLRVLEAIFKGEAPANYEGKHVRMKDGWFFPRPRSIELWITGDSEPGLQRVVRWGTGWFSSAWKTHDDYVRLNHRLSELLVAAGREPASVERGTDPFVCVMRTQEEAAEMSAADTRLQQRPAVIIAGDAERAKERFRELMAAGATYFELRLVANDLAAVFEMMELIATDVLPDLRRANVPAFPQ